MPPASSTGRDGLVILGFADNGHANFAGHVMDPDPVTVGPDGLLHVTPSQKPE